MASVGGNNTRDLASLSKPLQRSSRGKLYNSDAAAARAKAMEAAAAQAKSTTSNNVPNREDMAATGSFGGFASARGIKRNSPEEKYVVVSLAVLCCADAVFSTQSNGQHRRFLGQQQYQRPKASFRRVGPKGTVY